MKLNLNDLLPANPSDETAFHLVMFVRNLSLAIETIYFNEMLQHTSICEQDPFSSEVIQDTGEPF